VRKADLKPVVAALLFVSTVGVSLVGLLLGFVIPGGPAVSDDAKYLLGLHRRDWGDIHLYLGIAFVVLVALHLVLVWSWVRGKARQLFGGCWKAAMASMPVLAMLMVFVLWAVSPGDGWEGTRGAGASGRGPVARRLSIDRVTPSLIGSYRSHPTPSRASAGSRRYPDRPVSGRNTENQGGLVITGQMSLRDIERRTGLSARRLARQIGLPSGTRLDERLGRLKRTHGFSMQDVRAAVASMTR
jgi:hypothetical protein